MGMYLESDNVSYDSSYQGMTLINRLWFQVICNKFSLYHLMKREKKLLRNQWACAYKTWKIIMDHLSFGYKI